MKNKITIAVGTGIKNLVILRENGNIVLADLLDQGDFQTPPVLATSMGGCLALAEALTEMADAMKTRREYERKQEDEAG